MTSSQQPETDLTLPAPSVASLADLLTAIDGFLHTAHASISLAAYLRSRGSQLPEQHASDLIDWLSFAARTFHDLAGPDNDGSQHPQEQP